MRTRMYGGVGGRKTKVGRKLTFVFLLPDYAGGASSSCVCQICTVEVDHLALVRIMCPPNAVRLMLFALCVRLMLCALCCAPYGFATQQYDPKTLRRNKKYDNICNFVSATQHYDAVLLRHGEL